MGSLSQFITEDEVAKQLDGAFADVEQESKWDDYFDDCHFYLVKAQEQRAKISFQGAIPVVLYYYDKIICSSDNDITAYKAVHLMDQMLAMCQERHKADCPDWHRQLLASPLVSGCFLPALRHKQEDVQLFAIKQILHCCESSACSSVAKSSELVCAVLQLLSAGVSQVTRVAKDVLVTLCSSDEGLASVFSDTSALEKMNAVAAVSDTAKFNVYEVVQRVCVLGGGELSMVSNSGWLDRLVAEVTSKDTLAQLAALQLLADLMEADRALQQLHTAGVLQQLQATLLLAHNSQDSLAALNIPGLLKVFGAVGRMRPDLVCGEHSPVVRVMLQCSSGSGAGASDPCLSLLALETVTQLAASTRGKIELQHHFREEMQGCLQEVGEQLRSASMERRPRYLAALTLLLDVHETPQSERSDADEVSDVLHAWYGLVFPCRTVAPIDRFMRLPFQDLHLEALRLLTVLIKQPWGVTMVAGSDGVTKFLLDRGTETTKEGKEAKYEIVRALVEEQWPTLRETADHRTADLLKEYHKQGPFYVPPYAEVGLEELRR